MRPKVVNIAAERIFLEEARRRVEHRSNKEIARQLTEEYGITLSPQYIGQLVADQVRELRRKRKMLMRMFHGEQAELRKECGTIAE